MFEQQLLALGRQFFTRKAGKTRPIQLQPDTLSAIQFKRQALDLGRSTGELADKAFKSELKHIEKDVNRLVRRDVQAHYDDLLQQLQASGDIHDHRMVYRLLHKLGRRKGQAPAGPRPLPLLRASSGRVASTFAEQQNLWMTQFSQVEAGIVTTWDALQQQHSQDRMEPPADIEPDAFPNAWEIQKLLSRLKRDKVPGPQHDATGHPEGWRRRSFQAALHHVCKNGCMCQRAAAMERGDVGAAVERQKLPGSPGLLSEYFYLQLHSEAISPMHSYTLGECMGVCTGAPATGRSLWAWF